MEWAQFNKHLRPNEHSNANAQMNRRDMRTPEPHERLAWADRGPKNQSREGPVKELQSSATSFEAVGIEPRAAVIASFDGPEPKP